MVEKYDAEVIEKPWRWQSVWDQVGESFHEPQSETIEKNIMDNIFQTAKKLTWKKDPSL